MLTTVTSGVTSAYRTSGKSKETVSIPIRSVTLVGDRCRRLTDNTPQDATVYDRCAVVQAPGYKGQVGRSATWLDYLWFNKIGFATTALAKDEHFDIAWGDGC